jgi:hypothetical protein
MPPKKFNSINSWFLKITIGLPFTFGDLRRSLKHINKDSLNAVEGQEELFEDNDEEIAVAADEDSDSDEEDNE